jgi:hypothetical protein
MIDQSTTKNNGHIAPDDLPPFDDLALADVLDLSDLDTLRRTAVDLGIDLSQPKHQNAIAGRRAKARDLAQVTAPNQPPRWFYALRSLITSTGNALTLAVMLVLSYIAPPVAILGLAYAEIQRVSLGVALFDAPRADLMAIVAVSSYLVLLVVQAQTTRQNPDQARPVWSLRLWLRQFGYVLGIGRYWTAQQRTRAQLLTTAISRLAGLIILLGTGGSLADELATAPGAWYAAIWHILSDSSLMTFLALAGGMTLTAGLLAAMHFTVELTHQKWTNLLPEGHTDFLADSHDFSAVEDQAEALYLLSLIRKSQGKS